MKNLLATLAGLALLLSTAHAGGRTVISCDDNKKEDCRKYSLLEPEGDGVQILYLGDDDEEPSFVPLTRFLAQRGYLGVSVSELTPELRRYFRVDGEQGVLVSRVEEDSPAAVAGVRVGDVLTAVDGVSVQHGWDVARAVREKEAGDAIDIEVWRDGRPLSLAAVAAEREKIQFDLSGLTTSLEGLRQLDLQDLIDADAINESVRQAMEQFEDASKRGSYIFNFDPEVVEQFQKQWQMKFVDADGKPIRLGDLQGIEEQISERMRRLEERLRELEEELDEEDR